MKLSEARTLLPIYADGELDAPRAARLERALAQSIELRDELERWRSLDNAVSRAVSAVELPAGAARRLRAALHRRQRPQRTWIRRAIPLFAALSGAAAVVALYFAFTPNGSAAPLAIGAERFAKAFSMCGRMGHNTLVADRSLPADAKVALVAQRDYPLAIPDLHGEGYAFRGACECVGGPDLGAVHASYRSADARKQCLSVFSLDRRFAVIGATEARSGITIERTYEVASVDGISVVSWHEAGGNFVMASDLPRVELERLAGTFVVVRHDQVAATVAALALPLAP